MARSQKLEDILLIHKPVMLAIHAIEPAPYNPQKMSLQKFGALKSLIREVGFAEPVVVQKKTTMLISGHHRIRALKEICVEDGIPIPEIPAIVLDVDDRTAKRLNIAFNRVHGDPDARLLGELLVMINEETPLTLEEQEIIGFDDAAECNKYIHLVEPVHIDDGPPQIDTFGRSVTLSLEFKNVEQRDAVKKVLIEKAETAKKTTGELIAELLGCKVTKGKTARAKKRAA
jgi:ParB-like chromosome segregation protein Spo0J